MEFYVNDEKIDATLEDEKTVGDVLKSFEMTCEENNAAVIGITVNGEKITADSFDAASLKPLTSDAKFEFSIITKQAVFDSFKKLSSLFTELAQRMQDIPVALQTGRDKQANTAIKNLADSIEDFCRIAALASLFEAYSNITIDGKPFKEFFADFFVSYLNILSTQTYSTSYIFRLHLSFQTRNRVPSPIYYIPIIIFR